jgi:thiosulfate/3-mercaptopyruvate sulfurtransferase
MNSKILVSAQQLNSLINTAECKVVDCRFDFSRPEQGRVDWTKGRIPGAAYAHLDVDLAAPVDAQSGRHPLPDADNFAQFLASIGWSSGMLLVAYDGRSNAVSSRLWWLMRYFGQASALLDGGFAAWVEAGLPQESGAAELRPSPLEDLTPNETMTATSDTIYRHLDSPAILVLDARAPERFSGATENLDSKAGHIPGSVNRPFGANLDASGCFRPPAQLRAQFESVLQETGLESVVHSCGSGVTACHNLFAMELAGMSSTRLYPGSWSEWIRDPGRPIETGA